MRLNPEGVSGAFGSAASMASGHMQFTQDPVRTTIKRLYGGLPAERGVFSAQLAARGFSGPQGAIEGAWGFAKVMAGVHGVDRIFDRLGETFELPRVAVKLYSCCKLFHSLVEAIGNCRAEHSFTVDDIVAIEPFGPSHMIHGHMERRPKSMMAAQYSLPYVCAVVMLRDPSLPESFSEDALDDASLLRVADIVLPVVDESLEAIFPRKIPGGVRITLRSGAVLSSTVIDSKSSEERPLSRSGIKAKFRNLTKSTMSEDHQSRIIEMTNDLDRIESITKLTDLLCDLRSPT